MFDFKNASGAQRAAIATIDGPVLVKGSPGTGKTWILPRRAAYMVLERGIAPQNILLLMGSSQTAGRLRTQLDEVFAAYGILWAAPRIDIQTFASYCARLLAGSPGAHQSPAGTRILDKHAQQFMIYLHYPLLRRAIPSMTVLEEQVPRWMLDGYEEQWVYAGVVRDCVNRLTAALVDPLRLTASNDPGEKLLGMLLEQYAGILKKEFLSDTVRVQSDALSLLRGSTQSLSRARALTKYLLIDDYQNTSVVQAQLAALVAGRDGNLCVCADEDQAVFRAGGGRSDNVFGFPTLVPERTCQTIVLDVNFRSNEDIIRFTDTWMRDAGFTWNGFRKPRATIGTGRSLRSPGAVRLPAAAQEDWQEEIKRFIRAFAASGESRDLRQVMLTARNVRSQPLRALEEFLSRSGVDVFCPESPLFFERPEVRTAVGALWLAFQADRRDLRLTDSVREYYETGADEAARADGGRLGAWIKENADRPLLSIMAGALLRPPFDSWTEDIGTGSSPEAVRITLVARALEQCMRMPPLSGYADRAALFFEHWLPVLMRNGIEPDEDLRPRGALRVRPMHVLSDTGVPLEIVAVPPVFEYDTSGALVDAAERQYAEAPPAEPAADIERFDLWRAYYQVFSRAEDLLVLTGFGKEKAGSGVMTQKAVQALPDAYSQHFNLSEFSFREIADMNRPAPARAFSAPETRAEQGADSAAPGQKKSAPPIRKTRRFYRSVSVSAAGHNNVNDQTADNQDGNHKADDE